MTLKVETFPGGPIDTNAYLVFDDQSKEILIIDAPMEVDQALEDRVSELGGEVVLIVLTHAHWDHIGTTNQLHSRFSAPVAAHRLTEERLANPASAVMDLPSPGGDMPDIPAGPGVIPRQPVISGGRLRQIAMIGHVVAHFTKQRRQPRRP